MSGLQSFPGDVIIGDGPEDTATFQGAVVFNVNPKGNKNDLNILADYKLSAGDYLTTNGPHAGTVAVTNIAINDIYLSPIIPRYNTLIDTAIINVTAANIGAVCKIIVFNHDYTLRSPSTLLAISAEISSASIAQVSTPLNLTLNAKQQYWVGIWTGGATTQLSTTTSGDNIFTNNPAVFYTNFVGVEASYSYASPTPNYIPATYSRSSSKPIIGLRISSIS